jgi:hypothetical protein
MEDYSDIVNLVSDVYSGEVLMVRAADPPVEGHESEWEVVRWDPADPYTEDVWKPTRWRSKEFQFQYKENFSAYSIYWDHDRFTPCPDCTHIIPGTDDVWFTVYANRQVIYDQKVPRNGAPVRLPSGYKADIWQFEVRARAPVYSVHVASTVKELKSV